MADFEEFVRADLRHDLVIKNLVPKICIPIVV